jgi:cystatin-A/B
MLGGFGNAQELEPEERERIVACKGIVEERANRQFTEFEPVKVQKQVVAGMNYKVKIQVDNGEFIHVKIFFPLPHTNEGPQVSEYADGLTADD